MSVFGGSGFLGLGGTKFGETVSNIYEDTTDFLIGLPNEVVQIGENLGGTVFDTDSKTAQKFKDEAKEFHSRQIGGNIATGIVGFVTENIGLIGIAVIAFLIFKD